jgi:hypothetical protein
MKPKNRKAILLLLIVVAAVGTVTTAQVYWSKTLNHSITVSGIDADLLVPLNYEAYKAKTTTADLVSNKVFLTIYQENFQNLWLRISFTGPTGLSVSVTGQYYEIGNFGGRPYFTDPLRAAFSIQVNTEQPVNKTAMMYKNPEGQIGYALLLSFAFNTEAITNPGTYNVAIKFDLGPV